MITIIPAQEIVKAITDKNIGGDGANVRREAFDLAVELKSLADINLLIEGILYKRVEDRIEEGHKVFFQSTCTIDNSAKDVVGFDIVKAINWIADSESQTRKVLILTENVSQYSSNKNVNVRVITPADFVLTARRIVELTKKKEFISLDEFMLALFFFA